ncbi:MAG: ribosome maturation factor RimP [Gammaproteobacteria bacterium]|nr:ribosome maturation factor RimP [Gammaproteobacteria bacterium]
MIAGETLESLLGPTVEGMGYELWGIERQRSPRGLLLRVYIDHPEGITLDDCEKVSLQARDALDAEGMLGEDTLLEISSPGMDRLLFKPDHYQRHLGETVQVRLRIPVQGRRNFQGTLVAADLSGVVLEGEGAELKASYAEIDRTRVVPQWPDKGIAIGGAPVRKHTG